MMCDIYVQVQCDKCPNWHHTQCLDLKAEDLKKILTTEEPFFCLACHASDSCFSQLHSYMFTMTTDVDDIHPYNVGKYPQNRK